LGEDLRGETGSSEEADLVRDDGARDEEAVVQAAEAQGLVLVCERQVESLKE